MKIFCAATILGLAGFCLPVRAELVDYMNAVVNDKVITYQELRDKTAPAVDVLRQEYAEQPDLYEQKFNATLKDGMETLIQNQLILQEFATKYNPLPDSAVDEMVAERIKGQFGDRITCIKSLQAQGITFEKFRQDVRDQTIIAELRHRNLSPEKIIISPYKIENYYRLHQDEFKIGDQVKLRMIVLNKTSADDASARKRADEILDDLKKGASFDQLASVYSQDQGQQKSDWIESSVLRKELADAVATLKPGQMSDVIETSDDCYIVRLDDKRPAHVKPLNDVRQSIDTTLRAQEEKAAGDRWIQSLEKKAYIRYF